MYQYAHEIKSPSIVHNSKVQDKIHEGHARKEISVDALMTVRVRAGQKFRWEKSSLHGYNHHLSLLVDTRMQVSDASRTYQR